MERTLKPKDRAKMLHKRFKACGYDSNIFKDRFCPDRSNIDEYNEFIEGVNLYNKFFGYLARIEII